MLAFTSVVVAPWIQRRFGLHSSNSSPGSSITASPTGWTSRTWLRQL